MESEYNRIKKITITVKIKEDIFKNFNDKKRVTKNTVSC